MEYCSSSFTTTLYLVPSVSSLFIASPSPIRLVAQFYPLNARDSVAPVQCMPRSSPPESRHSACKPWSHDYRERSERLLLLEPNHSTQASDRGYFLRGLR